MGYSVWLIEREFLVDRKLVPVAQVPFSTELEAKDFLRRRYPKSERYVVSEYRRVEVNLQTA